MDYLLPATVYQSPSRLSRARQLNTIVEDNEEANCGFTSESEGTSSDNTVIGRPATLDVKYFTQASQRSAQKYVARPASVVSSEADDDDLSHGSSRDSYAGSDTGTVFSDSCPSLTGSHASDATTFAIESARNSTASRNSRNRYPALLIPRGSWQGFEAESKQVVFGMSPATKVRLSPEALDSLPKHVPALNQLPSFGDASSIRSASPCLPSVDSAPLTPNLHNIDLLEGQAWGGQQSQINLDTPLEIALDDEHSILISPEEAHSTPYSANRASSNYTEIMRQFPLVPGLTPIDTPVTPQIPSKERFESLLGDDGIQLPAQALALLQSLDKQRYAESSAGSCASRREEEMMECPVPVARPQSWGQQSPDSEYSISQLSIPSPGGFFSSLKAGTRSTWCSPVRKASSPQPPSSTTAENFYNAPWNQSSRVKETILEYEDGNETDGPPTVRQATFDRGVITLQERDKPLPQPCEEPVSGQEDEFVVLEDEDMYGDGKDRSNRHEYEEAYEDGLKQAAEANIDRTSHWLAAQTTYLSPLRETNPVNDSADFSAIPGASIGNLASSEAIDQDRRGAARFIEAAKATLTSDVDVSGSHLNPSPVKENMFLQAFTYQKSTTKRSDAFLHASSRLDSVESTRIATPKRHVQSLLNTHTSKTLEPEHSRPKYRGPFSQNPRNTGDLTSTAEQAEFHTLERQQTALNAIKPSLWSLEAQRTILYNGRLMANRVASERLTKKDADSAETEQSTPSQKPNKKRPRVLDLAGAATASWAWAAASKWPNAKVYTVQTKQQAELARNYPATQEEDVESYRPETPKNHKVCSVPHLWQMPFRNDYFDVVSARTLHMYLRANPVPGVGSIDEWDMTLRECMRVLKPGGILDFFVMDSGISNSNSSSVAVVNLSPNNMTSSNGLPTVSYPPKKKDITGEFKSELERRGYEADGGCARLMSRLKQEGFVGIRRQWIGLPMGSAEQQSSATKTRQSTTSSTSATSHWINTYQSEGSRRRPAFRSVPRPLSEVSEISKIVDQYAGVEAVQGPVGSTNDVADMSALLGELLWEEWLVRLRIESGNYTPETILDGVDEQFGEWRRSGKAAWRGVLGWARKPTKKETEATATVSTTSHQSSLAQSTVHFAHGFAIETPLPTPAAVPTVCSSASAGIYRQASVRRSRRVGSSSAVAGLSLHTELDSKRSGVNDWSNMVNEVRLEQFTLSAQDRGEVGEIPMFIMK